MSRLIIVCMLLAFTATAQFSSINAIKLKTVNGNKAYLLKQVGTPLLAIVLLSPECPLCQNYTRPLNEITRQYAGKVTVVGVFPGQSYTAEDYLTFQQKYKIAFPLLTDADKKLTGLLHGTVTPEVFLLDADRSIKYSGAIDNWITALGKHRKTATLYYLEAAIDSMLAGQPVHPDHTRPIGCYINDN